MEIYKSFVEKINDGDNYVLCHATSPFIKKESIIEAKNDPLKHLCFIPGLKDFFILHSKQILLFR